MRKLNEIFDTEYDIEINDVKTSSKEINEGDLFVCIMGFSVDRHDYVKEAEQKGARALVISRDVESTLPKIKVKDTNKELMNIINKFYDYPSKKVKMIGVTGTDGKTTTSTIIYKLLNEFEKTGYIGTNGVISDDYKESIINTTPAPEHIHRIVNNLYLKGTKNVVLETASEGLAQNRCETIEFDYSIFTNITPEHLNYHKTMENYLNAKCMLFEQTKKDGYCIINIDDENSNKIIEKCNGKVITYGKDEKADYNISNVTTSEYGTQFKLKYNNIEYSINIPLIGAFNAYNMTAALAVLTNMGYKIEELEKHFNKLFVAGRFDTVNYGQDFKVIIDFAHTPNAVNNILDFANSIKKNRIISVSGAAGGRYVEKRPIIGKMLVDKSDYVIFTYDDPRKEDINDIIDQMTVDVLDKTNKFERIVDRKEAIKKAINIAQKDDIVLILGRGNETMVPINDELIPENDYEEVEKAIKGEY